MINIILMAGKGQRFADAGYKISKPLLPVSGKSMIVRAVESMPPADKWVFVVRQDHFDDKEVLQTLKSVAKNVVVLVDPDPMGQLNSCLVAKDYFANEKDVFIGACDFGMKYDLAAYQKLLNNEERPDIISWSFTDQQNLARNPQAWGWLVLDNDNEDDNDSRFSTVKGVSVKVPISDNPINDHAITGSFTFASGKEFLKIADELMKRQIKIKNEFYIDSMLALAIELGYKVKSFDVNYVGWGTPADYEENKSFR